MSFSKKFLGLTTRQAFNELYTSVKEELENCECHFHQKSWFRSSWLKDAFHHNSEHSTFRWTSVLLLAIEAVIFLINYGVGCGNRTQYLPIECLFLILLLLINMTIVGWDNMLRHKEMHNKGETVLKHIEECSQNADDDSAQYPHLYMPQSPCISLQWTHRNGKLVNLPSHFLVRGDIIILRPGHYAPGKCRCIEEDVNCLELSSGDIFAPLANKKKESFTTVLLWTPVKPAKFLMLETPYINNLRYALQHSLKRPPTLFNRERHMVVSHYLECIIIPVILALTICVGIFHTVYISPETSCWSELILLRPALSILPLLSLALPPCWLLLNAYGMARLLLLVQLYKVEQKPFDPFDELEEIPSIPIQTVNWKDTKYLLTDLLFGKKGHLWRSANLMQVLGSITALCCVDKKGILSWPNPTAEKVFFLKPPQNKTDFEDNTYFSTPSVDIDDITVQNTEERHHQTMKFENMKDSQDHIYHPESQVEVLDLTHSIHGPFGLQFDDPKWKKYISNLKPLGLSILLNTCNPSSQEQYSKFCDHIACESLHNDAAVPVVNKRCLCELAKLIGFTDQAVDGYEFKHHLAVFRHVRPELIQKGRLARSLNFPRLKMPFPTMSCAVIKDLPRGGFQLFSQGTADLLLDVCSEYWDGQDICSLTESDRKRILDFYHRSSLTAHCMAFAYGPFGQCSDDQSFEKYIELPPDSSHLFHSKSGSSIRSWDRQSVEGKSKTILSRHLSTDSILLKAHEEDDTTVHIENCLQQLSNEIFIGMVTMQYQACKDFVQLIEQLDKACIRFVHFSKENELRSRVFSEKMGLESGWNCHISLLGEKRQSESINSVSQHNSLQGCPSKAADFHCTITSSESVHGNINDTIGHKPLKCVSAPSLINLDITTVKFEDEISMYSRSDESVSDAHSTSSRDQMLPHCMSNHSSRLISSNITPEKHTPFEMSHHLEEKYSIEDEHEGNLSHSPSHVTESTEQSAPVTFDMSNRAKLPKGIENIRPHIKNVDNVPLLVSLFTDCTPASTKEMICIMQENGEVVCCLGSSANSSNIPIFLQADVSIAIEPLYPQFCMQQPIFEMTSKSVSPKLIELSQNMNSLPCSVTFHREDPVSMYHLIMEARHFTGNMRTCLQFMLCCCLSLTLLQLLATLLFLPMPLPPAHLLWFVCLEVPLLSLSLLGNPADCQVMTITTGKNLKVVNKQTVLIFLGCYCAKFCPSVIVAISCFSCMVAHFCDQLSSNPCWILIDSDFSEETVDNQNWSSNLSISQNMLAFLLMLYFEIISMGFVQRSYLIWSKSPLTNKCWLTVVPIVLVLQGIFSIADVALHSASSEETIKILKEVPYYIWLIGLLWPIVLVPINVIVKRHEIKVNVRQQKKARLEFGTKLGMNSPF